MPAAALFLGKIAEQTASKNYFNWAVWLDATFPHVMLIAGKRGSGKSYDLGVLAEGLSAPDSHIAFGTEPFAMVLFDTQNQFWTLRAGNERLNDGERALLKTWRIEPVGISPPTVLRPRGTPAVGDFESEFAIRPRDLEPHEWTSLIDVERYSAMGQCIRAARAAMAEDFDVRDMLAWLEGADSTRFADSTVDAVTWRLEAAADSGLFDRGADDIIAKLAAPGQKSIVQLADLDDDTKSVVVSVVMRQLINRAGPAQRQRKLAARMGGDQPADDIAPRVWVLIDEAHLVCPAGKQTAARPVIVDYVKRGRDAGLSLVLATQQPSALDTAAISQCDIVAIHKLTIDLDIEAATARMPARAPSTATRVSRNVDVSKMTDLARSLDAGQSLFADSESSRAFVLQSRPRVVPHGGGEPEL